MERCRHGVEKVAGDGGLVLTTAGSINDGTPHRSMRALMRSAELHGRYGEGRLAPS